MHYDVITIGSAVEDITFYPKDATIIDNKQDILRQRLLAFEYGAKVKVQEAYYSFGGGAANASVTIKNMGLKSACICAVGDEYRGKMMIKNLKSRGVDVKFIQKNRDKMSGFSFILVGPDNEHVIFTHRAANSKLDINKNLLKKIKSDWLYITSLSGEWRKNLENIFKYQDKFKIAWNPGHIQLNEGQSLIRKYLKHVNVININEDEAIELVAGDKKVMANKKSSHRFLSNIKNLLTVIKSYGPQIVMITRGKKGADAYDGKKFYHVDVYPEVKRIDTTGVGDAYGSAFVCGLILYNNDIKQAMELGIKNAASVIAERGAQNGILQL